MINFGKRVKALRQAQKITKEEFCGDEAELSIRQLTRIESGVSTPTLAKVEFIANRLNKSIGELTDQKSFQLPTRYRELKFLLLRTQTLLDPKRIAQRKEYFEEIFNHFYDNLPEEEQLVIEILQSRMEIGLSDQSFIANKILADYLEQTISKSNYTINDLILINLYLAHLKISDFQSSLYDPENYNKLINNVIAHVDIIPLDELFMLSKVLFSAFSNCLLQKNSEQMPAIILAIESIINRTQDFQKMPMLNLIRWKYALFYQQDKEQAEFHYKNACIFSNLTEDNHLTEQLKAEWQKDSSTL